MLLVCLVTVCGVAAYGAIEPSVRETYDSGCVVDFSTAGCFTDSTAGKLKPPTITLMQCKADRGLDQACRMCRYAYDDQGQYKGYKVCAFVKESYACYCVNPNTAQCGGEGFCDYL